MEISNAKSRVHVSSYLFIYLFYFERMNTFRSTAILPCDPHITNEPPHYKTNLRMQKQRR